MDASAWKQVLSSGDDSDLTVHVGKRQFRLHKLPMKASSEYFVGLLRSGMSDTTNVRLDSLPGGEETMELVVDFCYLQPIENLITCQNIGHVMCAAHYLQVKNLTAVCTPLLQQFTDFGRLGPEVSLSNCSQILSNCEDVVPIAEASGVTHECISSLTQYLTNITLNIPLSGEPKGETPSRPHQAGQLLRDPKVLANWIDSMSRVPIIWIGRIIVAVSTNCPPTLKELATELTDMHLNYLASQGSLNFPDFDLLLKASAAAATPRESYDLPFDALEKTLVQRDDGVPRLSDSEVTQITQQMDFTKLSLGALERAVANERIPPKVTSRAAVTVCCLLRAQLQEKQKELRLQQQLPQQLQQEQQIQQQVQLLQLIQPQLLQQQLQQRLVRGQLPIRLLSSLREELQRQTSSRLPDGDEDCLKLLRQQRQRCKDLQQDLQQQERNLLQELQLQHRQLDQ